MKAEREKRANILDAEGFRQAAILKAEGEKQAVVLAAEGNKEAAFREAEARERLAQAEARATAMVSQAIAQGDVQAINYFVAQKYVEALKEFAASPNQKVFMMPMESAGLLGALGGIAELAKDAMQRQPSSLPPGSPGSPRTTPRAVSREAAELLPQHLHWWHWMVLAVLLAAAETLLPGAVIIWFAASAAVIGLLLIVIPIPWQWQLIGFGVLGIVALLLYRSYRKHHPHRRAAQPQSARPAVRRQRAGAHRAHRAGLGQGKARRWRVESFRAGAARGRACARHRRQWHDSQGDFGLALLRGLARRFFVCAVGEVVREPVLAGLEDDIGRHAEIAGDQELGKLSRRSIHQRLPAVSGDEIGIGPEQHEDVDRAGAEGEEGQSHDEEREPAARQHRALEPALQHVDSIYTNRVPAHPMACGRAV